MQQELFYILKMKKKNLFYVQQEHEVQVNLTSYQKAYTV